MATTHQRDHQQPQQIHLVMPQNIASNSRPFMMRGAKVCDGEVTCGGVVLTSLTVFGAVILYLGLIFSFVVKGSVFAVGVCLVIVGGVLLVSGCYLCCLASRQFRDLPPDHPDRIKYSMQTVPLITLAANPAGPYPAGQPGAYPAGQPGAYPAGQPWAYPGQPVAYPAGQPGPYPAGQPGAYPAGQPEAYPAGQPGAYPGPGAYPAGQPEAYPGEPGAYPVPPPGQSYSPSAPTAGQYDSPPPPYSEVTKN